MKHPRNVINHGNIFTTCILQGLNYQPVVPESSQQRFSFPQFHQWCFRKQVRLAGSPNDWSCCSHPVKHMQWTTDNRTDSIFDSSGAIALKWLDNFASKCMIRESSMFNHKLWLGIDKCGFLFLLLFDVCLPNAMLWGGFGHLPVGFQQPPTQILRQKFWLKRKRWLEHSLFDTFLEKQLQLSQSCMLPFNMLILSQVDWF